MSPPLDLDRAAHLRTEAHLDRVSSDPTTVLVPIWRGKSLVTSGDDPRACLPTVAAAPGWALGAEHRVYLGRRGEVSYLMVDLPRDAEPVSPTPGEVGGGFADLRFAGVALPPDEFALLAYARGMAHFHRSERFDEKTGQPTRPAEAGFARELEDGSGKVFPRTDPAVMVLITRGETCLLARSPRFPERMFSALAGFVEPGESLEECVQRETLEEVGLRVEAPRYVASQAWPFPRSLMVGFVAEAPSGDVVIDGVEIVETRWTARAEIERPEGFFVPPAYSLAHRLITGFARRAW